MLVNELFIPLSKHFIVISSEKELFEIGLRVMLALTKSNAMAKKKRIHFGQFSGGSSIFLLLTLESLLQLLFNVTWLS